MRRTIALTPREAADLHLVAKTHRLPGDSLVFRTMSLMDAQREAERIREAVNDHFTLAGDAARLPQAA